MPLLLPKDVEVKVGMVDWCNGGMGRGRGRGRGGGQGDAVPEVFQSYDDKDDGNALLAFTPNHPAGVHFDIPFLGQRWSRQLTFLFYI